MITTVPAARVDGCAPTTDGRPTPADGFAALSHRLARTVVVVTTGLPGRDDPVHAMTADSLATVSVHPPMICVGLRRTARTLELIRVRRSFAVSVLGEDQQPVATGLASRRRPPGAAQLDGIGWRPASTVPAPLIDGAVGWFEVAVLQLVAAGDHVLVLADVLDAGTGPEHRRPLVRSAGCYR